MAYESRIYVVSKTDMMGYEEQVKDYKMCEIIASFNLCRIDDEILGMISHYPESDCYLWVDGEATATDRYGEHFTEIPLDKAIEIFIHAKNFYDYRRYTPVASMLTGFNPKEWKDLVVLHYGY